MPTDEAEEHAKSVSAVTPGDAQGVPVPHEDAMEGTSEQASAIDGVPPPPQSTKRD